MNVLVAGWFSFENMGATAGDLMAKDVIAGWLNATEASFDVALASPFVGGVDWRQVDPEKYEAVVFVCGPFGNGPPLTKFLTRFDHCRRIGVDLSMLEPVEAWNPFDLLLERDSSRATRPDLSFLARVPPVPVVGVILVHSQSEYGDRGHHAEADAAIERLLDAREVARVTIDTRLDENAGGLRSAAEVESLIARIDVVVTTRLHGLVLALKNDVPAVAVDAIAGGAKVSRQAEILGWPHVLLADDLDDEHLSATFDACLEAPARERTRECRDRAIAALREVRERFLAGLDASG